jgi:hypothetical protein
MAFSWDLGAVLVTYADALDSDEGDTAEEAAADRILKAPLLPPLAASAPPPPSWPLAPEPPPPPPLRATKDDPAADPRRPRLMLAGLAACTLFLGAVHLAFAASLFWP